MFFKKGLDLCVSAIFPLTTKRRKKRIFVDYMTGLVTGQGGPQKEIFHVEGGRFK